MSSFKCPPEGADCSIEGDADLYGMGVRLGIYMTWTASWIANTFVPDEIDQALDTNSIFLFAISFGTAYYTGSHKIKVIDVLLLMQLSFGYIFTVMTIWGYRTACYWKEGARACCRFGGWGTHLRLILLAGIATHFVLSALRFSFLVVLAWAARFLVRDWKNPGKAGMNLLKQRIGHECLEPKEFAGISYFMAMFTFASGVFWIVAVEKTLLENHVAGVWNHRLTSPGQLIPLCIGVLGVIKVIFACFWAARATGCRTLQKLSLVSHQTVLLGLPVMAMGTEAENGLYRTMKYETIGAAIDKHSVIIFDDDQGSITPSTWQDRVNRTTEVAVIKDRGQEGRRPSCSNSLPLSSHVVMARRISSSKNAVFMS